MMLETRCWPCCSTHQRKQSQAPWCQLPWGASTSPAGLDPLCINTDTVRAETAQLWLSPHCWSIGHSAFNRSLSNLPSISDSFPDKHSLLELVFYQEEGYFQTNEDIQTGRGRKRKKKQNPSATTLSIHPMRKTSQAVRISLISNQEKHLQLHTAFLCFTKKSDKAVSLLHCHTLPRGRFYSFLHSQGISSPGILSPSTSWKDTSRANPHSNLETGTEDL